MNHDDKVLATIEMGAFLFISLLWWGLGYLVGVIKIISKMSQEIIARDSVVHVHTGNISKSMREFWWRQGWHSYISGGNVRIRALSTDHLESLIKYYHDLDTHPLKNELIFRNNGLFFDSYWDPKLSNKK